MELKMRIKIVYFSLSGNTKMIAESIAKENGADLVEIKSLNEYPTKGLKKYFWGGKSVILKEKPLLENYDKSLDYDLIILATPIWAGSFTPPMRTYLSENDLNGKKVAFFVCHMGGGTGRCFKEFSKLQPNCHLVSTLDLNEPKSRSTEAQIKKVQNWVKDILL